MDNKIIKHFSKEQEPGKRKELADEIRVHRTKHFEQKNQENAERLEIEKITFELETLSDSLPGKIFNYLKIRKLKKELQAIKSEGDANEESSLSEDKEEAPDLEVVRKKLREFYETQKTKWEEMPYDKNEVAKYFSEEYLEGLSLNDYKLLLKRFSAEMVTHVTRQGVRDHFSMMDHSTGIGQHWNGFTSILSEGKLSSGMCKQVSEEERDKIILANLNRWGGGMSSEETTLKALESYTDTTSQHFAAKFVDFHSVHFAAKKVADAYYGAEVGNEIFMAYPAHFISANYFFRNDPHEERASLMYNDVWVYEKEKEGISINAGLVFIPADAQVDPLTGSQYEVSEKGEAREDDEYVKKIREIIETEEFKKFSVEAEKRLGKTRDTFRDRNRFGISPEDKETYKHFTSECQKLFGITDEKTLGTILDYNFHFDLRIPSGYRTGTDEIVYKIKKRLLDEQTYYKRASKTISSREYWEDYFVKNPDQKPSKLVYYEGSDPTGALNKWLGGRRDRDNTTLFPEKKLIGDTQNQKELPSIVVDDMERFKSIARNIIHKHFRNQTSIETE